ncbi:MAG: hypothetical protein HYR94_11805 [Chloroflexi bacterium]|nr:hypothetical protein [Chloroflexota bacterium]
MPSSNATEANGPAGQTQPAAGEIDLKALAEKIYKLLKEEARLERERLGRLRTG